MLSVVCWVLDIGFSDRVDLCVLRVVNEVLYACIRVLDIASSFFHE